MQSVAATVHQRIAWIASDWLTDWQNDTSCRNIKWLTNAKETGLRTSLVCTPRSLYQDYRIQYQLPMSSCIHTKPGTKKVRRNGKFLGNSNELHNLTIWVILSLLTYQLSAVYKSGSVRGCRRTGSLCWQRWKYGTLSNVDGPSEILIWLLPN